MYTIVESDCHDFDPGHHASAGVVGRRTGELVRVGLGTFPVITACLDITKTSREHFGKIKKIMIVESQMSIFGVMSLLRIS